MPMMRGAAKGWLAVIAFWFHGSISNWNILLIITITCEQNNYSGLPFNFVVVFYDLKISRWSFFLNVVEDVFEKLLPQNTQILIGVPLKNCLVQSQ